MTTPFASCSRCGFQAAGGTRFCPNCGGTMAAPPMATSVPASAGLSGTVPPPPFPAATLLCGQCGTEFSAGTKFCPNCGVMAGSAPPPGPVPVPPPRMAAPFLCGRCGSQISAGTNFCPHCGNSAGPGTAADQSRYAGFGIRFLADLIDTIVLLVVFFLLELVPILNFFVPATLFISVMVTSLYGAMTESSTHQASLGKRALGLKVTDQEGKRISFGTGFSRWVIKTIPFIGWFGCLVVLFTQKKQGVHDLMAGTLVWRTA